MSNRDTLKTIFVLSSYIRGNLESKERLRRQEEKEQREREKHLMNLRIQQARLAEMKAREAEIKARTAAIKSETARKEALAEGEAGMEMAVCPSCGIYYPPYMVGEPCTNPRCRHSDRLVASHLNIPTTRKFN